MNRDIRISIEFWDHHKTVKLKRRIGPEGPEHLQRIWSYAARHRPDGILAGMSEEDITIAARYDGNADDFVATLVDIGWIDQLPDGEYAVHDWEEHNPWAAKVEERSDMARLSRMAKTHPEIYERLKEEGVQSISKQEYDRLTTPKHPINDSPTDRQRSVNPALTPAPAPAPAPSPSPSPNDKRYTSDSDEIRLSTLLFALLRVNNPGHKQPDLQKWALHIDRAIRLDNRSPPDLETLIRWSQQDAFWSGNILSTKKLRAKFDQLTIQMKGASNNHVRGPNGKNSGTSQGAGADTGKYDALTRIVSTATRL